MSDGLNNYRYDAENRICAVQSTVTGGITKYLYDAFGRRVAKSTGGTFDCARNGTLTYQYLLGQGGEEVTQLSGSGSWNYSNVYAGGRLLATYRDTNTYFSLNDWLGTKRVEALASGKACATYVSMPFGNNLATSGTGLCSNIDSSDQHFTGKQREQESLRIISEHIEYISSSTWMKNVYFLYLFSCHKGCICSCLLAHE